MSRHKGEHPRFGATDVCPFVPVSGITMEETVVYARRLAERVGKELHIPVYCYENAAFNEGNLPMSGQGNTKDWQKNWKIRTGNLILALLYSTRGSAPLPSDEGIFSLHIM